MATDSFRRSARRREDMPVGWSSGRSTARFWILAVLVMLVAFGGGSRTAVPSLLVIRPACVIAMAALFVSPGRWDAPRYRPLIWLLTAWALTIAIQLVPLPPALFLSLPGRGVFAQAAMLAGHAQSWRPLSLAPDLTLNSLLALLVPVAVLTAFAGLGSVDRMRTPALLLAIVAASALLAAVQIVSGPESAAYLYQSTDVTLPDGLLANRNHQATLMAIGLAVLMWHAGHPVHRPGVMAMMVIVLACVIVGLIGLVTGSRSGLLLMGAGLTLGFLAGGGLGRLRQLRRRWFWVVAAVLCAVLALGAAIVLGRAAAIDRLAAAGEIDGDLRFRAFPAMMDMIRTYAPIGTGFGTFDPVFRKHEPETLLNLFYFNNAHDDFLEILITGGVPAVAVLLAVLAWLAVQARSLMRPCHAEAPDRLERMRGRLGLVVIGLLAMASLSDYPLRTPLMALIGSIAVCWVALPRRANSLGKPEALS